MTDQYEGKYSGFTAAAIQSAVNAKLAPGFCLYSAVFCKEATGEIWFNARFSYCDREKYAAMRAEYLDKDDPVCIQGIVDMIELTPVLQDCPEGHSAAVFRCLSKNPAYTKHPS